MTIRRIPSTLWAGVVLQERPNEPSAAAAKRLRSASSKYSGPPLPGASPLSDDHSCRATVDCQHPVTPLWTGTWSARALLSGALIAESHGNDQVKLVGELRKEFACRTCVAIGLMSNLLLPAAHSAESVRLVKLAANRIDSCRTETRLDALERSLSRMVGATRHDRGVATMSNATDDDAGRTMPCHRHDRALMPGALDFSASGHLYGTHGLHAFAARLPPPLARWAIESFTDPGDFVLDVMCGSGTTLVEGLLTGRHARGVDIDPLARLISMVKSTPIPSASVLELAGEIEKCLTASTLDGSWRPALPRLGYWFRDDVSVDLARLKSAIVKTTNEESALRSLAWVVFSSLIVARTSVANARDLVHSRLAFHDAVSTNESARQLPGEDRSEACRPIGRTRRRTRDGPLVDQAAAREVSVSAGQAAGGDQARHRTSAARSAPHVVPLFLARQRFEAVVGQPRVLSGEAGACRGAHPCRRHLWCEVRVARLGEDRRRVRSIAWSSDRLSAIYGLLTDQHQHLDRIDLLARLQTSTTSTSASMPTKPAGLRV